jgi:beta-phosphoglucomutase-like phosphatase (HAD superfamily)
MGMKCWNSTFNAQVRECIVIGDVHVGVLKIYVATMKAFMKKERHD